MEHEKEHKEDKIEESTEEKEKVSNKKENLVDKIKKDPWKASTIVLGVVCLIFLFSNLSELTGSTVTGSIVNEEDAGELALNFFNNKLSNNPGTLTSIEEVSGIYKVGISVQGEEISLYFTKDGKWISQGGPLTSITEESIQQSSQQQSAEPIFTEEQNVLIQEFSSCLYEKGIRVYYAGWCGHCHTLIETFGGLENAGEMMIECQTENQQPGEGADLCATENITGFPTIKVNGESYQGSRTFEAFAEATGCSAPELSA